MQPKLFFKEFLRPRAGHPVGLVSDRRDRPCIGGSNDAWKCIGCFAPRVQGHVFGSGWRSGLGQWVWSTTRVVGVGLLGRPHLPSPLTLLHSARANPPERARRHKNNYVALVL